MKMFHFTNLIHLPNIMREGITRGEVPINIHAEPDEIMHGGCLTTDGDFDMQRTWGANSAATNKTKIRITVEVPETELTSYRQLIEQFNIPKRFLNAWAPEWSRRRWWFAFGGVRPSQFTRIEMLNNGRYEVLTLEQLTELVEKIERETEASLQFTTEFGFRLVGLRPGREDSWLLDGLVK